MLNEGLKCRPPTARGIRRSLRQITLASCLVYEQSKITGLCLAVTISDTLANRQTVVQLNCSQLALSSTITDF